MIKNEKYKKIHPYYHNFKGTIKKLNATSYQVSGCYEVTNNKVEITELPIGESIFNYKNFLEKLLDSDANINSYSSNCTDNTIEIALVFKTLPKNIEDKLKLNKKINLTNLHAYTSKGNIEKFKNIDYDNYNASGWNKVVYIGNKYNNLSLFI
jgi:DNA topoisomerase-2